MVSNVRDRNIDSSRREDSRKGQVDRCEVVNVRPHVAPYPDDKDFNTVDVQLIDRPRINGKPLHIKYVKLNSLQRYHGKFQGEPWTPRIGDMIYVYWLAEREALVLGLCTSVEQEPVCRSQADAHHQEYVFKLCPWEEPKTNDDKNYIEFPDPKHPECYKWWPKTRDSLWIFDCLEGHNTPSCCAQACNSLDDHQSSTCFKNFSDISPTTIDKQKRFKFLHRCGSYWYYDNDGTIELASKLNAALKCHQTFYSSGRILLKNDVTGNFVDIKAADEVEIDAATIRLDGDVVITGSCTHGSCSCEGEFAQLDGVAGGQTLCGGTGVDEELTLCGTSDASKGCVKVDADLACTGGCQLPSVCGSDQVDGELTLSGTSDASKGCVTVDSDLECTGALGSTIKSSIKSYCDGLYSSSGSGVTNGDSHDHSGGDGARIDHGGLNGLSDDDHSQYVKLAGRSGGQTIQGGTASGDDLILESTANATKGMVCIGPGNGKIYIGEDPYDATNAVAGWGFQRYTDGSLYTAWKTVTGGSINLRCGAGAEKGYARTFLTITPSTGACYFLDNVSALSFTDRTPGYNGDALAEMKNITNDARGRISHKTLPAFARAKFTDPSTGQETEGRNIGNMVSILTKAVQQLTEKLEAAEKRIAELEARL